MKTIFSSRHNLKNLVCRNKSTLFPISFSGVYRLHYTCYALYLGQTEMKVIAKTIEYQQDSFNGKRENPGEKTTA